MKELVEYIAKSIVNAPDDVVVSEETGAVSIAEQGRLDADIPLSEFPGILAQRLEASTSERAEDGGGEPSDKPAAT